MSDEPSPHLRGTALDNNSLKGPILPWLRSIDGENTVEDVDPSDLSSIYIIGMNSHDDAFALSIAGGVTTSLVLPGSANAIGKDFCISTSFLLRLTLYRRPSVPH